MKRIALITNLVTFILFATFTSHAADSQYDGELLGIAEALTASGATVDCAPDQGASQSDRDAVKAILINARVMLESIETPPGAEEYLKRQDQEYRAALGYIGSLRLNRETSATTALCIDVPTTATVRTPVAKAGSSLIAGTESLRVAEDLTASTCVSYAANQPEATPTQPKVITPLTTKLEARVTSLEMIVKAHQRVLQILSPTSPDEPLSEKASE